MSLPLNDNYKVYTQLQVFVPATPTIKGSCVVAGVTHGTREAARVGCQYGSKSRAGAGAVAALSCQKSCGRAPARNNMCAWCYRDHLNAIDKAAEPEVARIRTMLARLGAEVAAAAPKPTATNRCAACRKKVGLLGFACRCARTFCSLHRHAESHACGFDYKTAGRERIAASNPVVVAPKIAKI